MRAEAIIVQLVFEHSLRIRMKAETTNSGSSPAESLSAIPLTPDSESMTEDHTTDEASGSSAGDETTMVDGSRDAILLDSSASTSSSSSAAKQKAVAPKEVKTEAAAKPSEADGSNLVGKINNLVTTDLGNIIDARDFLFILIQMPLQVGLCISFLYAILGWR